MTSYLICAQRSCTYSLQSYDFPHTLRISVPPVTLSFTSYPSFTALLFILIFWIQAHEATFSSFQGVYSEMQISLSLLNPRPQFLHSEAISFFLSLSLSLRHTHTETHTPAPMALYSYCINFKLTRIRLSLSNKNCNDPGYLSSFQSLSLNLLFPFLVEYFLLLLHLSSLQMLQR